MGIPIMSERGEKPVRILVALDASRRSVRALDLAAALAARRNAELVALVVENVNLFNLAELPFAMEIDCMLGVERKVDPSSMMHSMQLCISHVREMLAQLSSSKRVQSSLTVVRGHYMREAISAASEIDVLFLGQAPYRAGYSLKTSGTKEEKRTADLQMPVWALFDGTETSKRALTLAGDLAHSEQRRLMIALQADSGKDVGRLRREAAAHLGDIKFECRGIANTAAGIADLLEIIKREGAALVVTDRQYGEKADEILKMLLEGIECPVVVVA